jgi:hypothetical protein
MILTKQKRILPTSLIALFMALGFCLVYAQSNANKLPLLAASDFGDGTASGWKPNQPGHWRVTEHDGSLVYELVVPGAPGQVRAPSSYSLLAGYDVTSFVFTGRLQCKSDTTNPQRDMCVFFHFQDPTHFYYIHFSARSDGFHNIIGLVNGADRIKINLEPAGKSTFRLTETEWHGFKVTCEAATGKIQAYLDDMETPILTAVDKTLGHGLVGVGSFDDTGYFDDIKLWGDVPKRSRDSSATSARLMPKIVHNNFS